MHKPLANACFILIAACATGCAQTPAQTSDTPVTRISKDYEAIGNADGIRPFIYGKRTLIDPGKAGYSLTIRDEHDVNIPYTREGRYYVVDHQLNYFTITTGGKEVAFTLAPPEPPALGPLVDERIAGKIPDDASSPLQIPSAPMPPAAHLDWPEFVLMKQQLHQYRRLLDKAESIEAVTGRELQALSNKLIGMDRKMEAGTAIVHVYFPENSSSLPTDASLLKTLAEAARNADRINIYGRSSAEMGGKRDASVATERAERLRKYLLSQGVSGTRIHTSALAEGDFIVATRLKEADFYNRRAAVEIIREYH